MIKELAETLGVHVSTFPAVDTDRRTNMAFRALSFKLVLDLALGFLKLVL